MRRGGQGRREERLREAAVEKGRGGVWSPVLSVESVGRSVSRSVGGARGLAEAHVSQPIRSVLSRDRDLVLCGDAGLGGLLKVELLEAVE